MSTIELENLIPKVITSNMEIQNYNCEKIVMSLVNEIHLDKEICTRIALNITRKLVSLKTKFLTSPMLRELVCSELIELGYENERLLYTRLGLPYYDFKILINSKRSEEEKKEQVYSHLKKEYYEINKIYKNNEIKNEKTDKKII